ncbi:hypothetical protein F66182_2551 [Fusarium sp. NRRL 66182]|nr:hypothetical protein F66182_2551 [Fusarium sp. NRRL 66182]
MFRQTLLLNLVLIASVCSLLCTGPPTGIKYVYRADSRIPDQINEQGGFLPRGSQHFPKGTEPGVRSPGGPKRRHARILNGFSRSSHFSLPLIHVFLFIHSFNGRSDKGPAKQPNTPFLIKTPSTSLPVSLPKGGASKLPAKQPTKPSAIKKPTKTSSPMQPTKPTSTRRPQEPQPSCSSAMNAHQIAQEYLSHFDL